MIPNWLSWVDIIFIVVVLLFAWGGFQKGFAGQVAHILTFVILGGFLFFAYPAMFNYLGRVFRNAEDAYLMWLLLAGAAVLSIAVFILLSKLLAGLLKMQFTDRADQVNGFLFGGVRGVLTALLVMILLVMLGPPEIYQRLRERSPVGRLVCYELVPRIQPRMSRAVLGEKVDRLRHTLLEQEEAPVY